MGERARILWDQIGVEFDPIIGDLCSRIDEVTKRFSPYSRTYHMDRKAAHIFRLELKVMASGSWARMKRKVDIGTAKRDDPAPRVVKIHKLGGPAAIAGDYLEVDTGTANLPDKHLKDTIAHEMIHYWLDDTGAYHGVRARDLRHGNGRTDYHGRLFRECCEAYGLKRGRDTEVVYRYQYKCPCGWWLKTVQPRPHQITCSSCHKMMVTPTEYKRLQKMAAIGSRSCPVRIESYVIRSVKRLA